MIKVLNLEGVAWNQTRSSSVGLCSFLPLWVNLVSILRYFGTEIYTGRP